MAACCAILKAAQAAITFNGAQFPTCYGSCYRSKAFREACRDLGLKHIRTRPYTPKTNGKAERFIQTALREWAYAQAYPNSDRRAAELPIWLHRYNWHRPHGSLKSKPPISRLALDRGQPVEAPQLAMRSPRQRPGVRITQAEPLMIVCLRIITPQYATRGRRAAAHFWCSETMRGSSRKATKGSAGGASAAVGTTVGTVGSRGRRPAAPARASAATGRRSAGGRLASSSASRSAKSSVCAAAAWRARAARRSPGPRRGPPPPRPRPRPAGRVEHGRRPASFSSSGASRASQRREARVLLGVEPGQLVGDLGEGLRRSPSPSAARSAASPAAISPCAQCQHLEPRRQKPSRRRAGRGASISASFASSGASRAKTVSTVASFWA